jgi:hypothetical protein
LSTTETVLTFVVVPTAIFLAISGLALAGSVRRNKRYRPGRPFGFTPVWFLSSPEQLNLDGARELTAGPAADQRRAVTAGETPPETATQDAASQGAVSRGVATPLGATGGASDRW